mmetsp:Transcript_28999/g.60649  ORF Transcript_28999/g.60649 Transcript_28999/m.60649 type:complete len:90 (+) Transcript_28999:808-1077(+)
MIYLLPALWKKVNAVLKSCHTMGQDLLQNSSGAIWMLRSAFTVPREINFEYDIQRSLSHFGWTRSCLSSVYFNMLVRKNSIEHPTSCSY